MMGNYVDISSPPVTYPREDSERPRRVAKTVTLGLQLTIVVAVLIVLGLVMIYSASSVMAIKAHGDSNYYAKRQTMCILAGMVAMLAGRLFPYAGYRKLAPLMLVLSCLSLLVVLLPGAGAELNGARRWFKIGPFFLQPSEFGKVVWVIYLSAFLERKAEKIQKFCSGFLPAMFLLGVIGLLLLRQPDFGSALVLGVVTASLLAAGNVPWMHLSTLVPSGLVVSYKAVYSVQYRWERIKAFVDPWATARDSGYQLIQAWIALGSGGIWGKGLGAGQQKLFFLPEPYTDFILAVVGEELGLTGIFGICVLFLLIAWIGLQIAHGARDYFGGLLALGLTLLLSLQALINMAVVVGLFPTKGLPLPFISYGGSALIANCLAVGILLNIASRQRVE